MIIIETDQRGSKTDLPRLPQPCRTAPLAALSRAINGDSVPCNVVFEDEEIGWMRAH